MSTPPDVIPTPQSEIPEEINLPIQHLLQVDPLKLSSADLTLLVQYYRLTRSNFLVAEQTKPKTTRKSRGPALSGDAARSAIDAILSGKIGGDDD